MPQQFYFIFGTTVSQAAFRIVTSKVKLYVGLILLITENVRRLAF